MIVGSTRIMVKNPFNMAIDQCITLVYVTSYISGNILVIGVKTNNVMKNVTAGLRTHPKNG
jgi:YVTN family beta-propeller protein